MAKERSGKLVCLAAVDSQTGAVTAVPVGEKASVKHMTKEQFSFSAFVGAMEMVLRSDSEPTLLKIQDLVKQTRARMGLLTHQANGLCEVSAQRVPGLASTILHLLRDRQV